MTRLIDDWIKNIKIEILEMEKDLLKKSGLDYISLGIKASGNSFEKIDFYRKNKKVAIIPITTGLGIIGTFAESVKAIINSMGFSAFITEKKDVSGIYEANLRGAEIIFLADDERFLAVNLSKNKVVENNFATGSGFVSALEGSQGTLEGKEVLVIGYGPVGQEIVKILMKKNAIPVIYDRDKKAKKFAEDKGYRLLSTSMEIRKYELILDATSSGQWLREDMLNPKVWISTPGVPLSLTKEAYEIYKDRLIHDYLPIGVAVMMAMTCL